jgi:NDP-sugar pyrophosphorylase family protein
MVKAIVLAGGAGTRLGELAEHTPKPLAVVGGRSILEHDLRWLAAHDVRDVTVAVHAGADAIRAAIGDGAELGLAIRWAREPTPLGTAGACAALRPQLGEEPFLVVSGDNLMDFDLTKLLAAHADNAAVATLALYSPATQPHTGGAEGRVEMDRSGRILRYVEGREDQHLPLVSAGCYVVEPALLDHVPTDRACDFGRDLFAAVLRKHGILCGHRIDGACYVVDTLDDLLAARRLFEARQPQ